MEGPQPHLVDEKCYYKERIEQITHEKKTNKKTDKKRQFDMKTASHREQRDLLYSSEKRVLGSTFWPSP